MSEPDFDIDAAEQQYNDARQDEPPADDPPPNDDIDDQDDGNDTPPGFKSFEEYVADGGDPDDYVGKKAYERHHARIQDNKGLRDEVKDLKGTVQQTMEATNAVLEQTEARVRAEVEAELHQAREDEDVDAALTAQGKLDDMDAAAEQRRGAPPQQRPTEHPTITAFRESNPMLDHNSNQFDQDFNEDVEAAFNVIANQGLTGTDRQVKAALKKAMDIAKGMHAEKFESPRNNRQQNQQRRQQRRTNPGDNDTTPNAEGYVIKNPRNPRQGNAAPEVRDMIQQKAEDAARKAGKSDEDIAKAGKKAAKDFERSLAQ
ncbi:MAG: hypothetical protein ACR2PR_06890 [Pseudohongiellaceae bacterium]